MANLTPHAFAGDARNPFLAGSGGTGNETFTLAFGTDNLGAGDTAPLYHLAQDCIISDVFLEFTLMDAHATPTLAFDVGIDSDDNAIMSNVDASAAGSSITMVADQIALSAGDIIEVSVLTAAATAAAGTVTLSFRLQSR